LRDSWQLANDEVLSRTRQLEELIETAPDAIVIFDSHTEEILDTNFRASELLGYSRDRIIQNLKMGCIVVDTMPSETDRSRSMRPMIEAAMRGQSTVFEAKCINTRGVEIPCELTLSRLPTLGSSLLRASILDITDRKAAQKRQLELQEKLAASQRLETIGKLAGGVAHDFNNLLAVIMGNLELLQMVNESADDQQLVQACLSASRRGADLVASMLAFAKRAPLQPEIANLNTSIEDTHAWAGRTIPSNIELETSFDDHLWSTRVDVSALNSAVLNLILNARDAMPEGGRLTLRTANQAVGEVVRDDLDEELLPGRYVTVEVIDTGVGIPPETMGSVLEPFFSTKGAARGSGLGLPMVFGFMGQSGGVLHIFSKEGSGTSVKLYFPAVLDEPNVKPRPPANVSPSPPLSARILLVEDNVQLASTIERTLRQAGHSVHLAVTGDAAKAAFVSDPHFDLLLTDMVMPGTLQGRELAAELRSIKPSLSVIFMSGHAGFQHSHEGHAHMGIHLAKPVPHQKLKEAVSTALTQDRGVDAESAVRQVGSS
ncbi:MAG: ATP-binding protein, partial [Myxococcota bacterium]